MSNMVRYGEVPEEAIYRNKEGKRLKKLEEGSVSGNNAWNFLTLLYEHDDTLPDELVELIELPRPKTSPPPL